MKSLATYQIHKANSQRETAISSSQLFHHSHTNLRKLTTRSNHNRGLGRAAVRSHTFDSPDDIHTLDDATEDTVLPVKPRRFGGAQKELRSVRVGTGVGHR